RAACDTVDSSHLRKGIRSRLGVPDRTALAKKRGAAEAAPRFSLRARIGGPASCDTVRDRPAARGTPIPLLRFRSNRSGRIRLDDQSSFLAYPANPFGLSSRLNLPDLLLRKRPDRLFPRFSRTLQER